MIILYSKILSNCMLKKCSQTIGLLGLAVVHKVVNLAPFLLVNNWAFWRSSIYTQPWHSPVISLRNRLVACSKQVSFSIQVEEDLQNIVFCVTQLVFVLFAEDVCKNYRDNTRKYITRIRKKNREARLGLTKKPKEELQQFCEDILWTDETKINL